MCYKEKAVFFSALVECLLLLSASCTQQIEAFPDFVCVPDELALTFDERYAMVPCLLENGFLAPSQKQMLDTINDDFDRMDENKNIWSLEALAIAEEWSKIRLQARTLLDSLDLAEYQPDMYRTVFIQASSSNESYK